MPHPSVVKIVKVDYLRPGCGIVKVDYLKPGCGIVKIDYTRIVIDYVTTSVDYLKIFSRAVAHSRARYTKAGCALEAAAGTAHHGLGPMKKDASPVRWPCVGYKPTITGAAWRARVASACAAPRHEIHRAQWRTRVCATRKPAVCSRPQLARRGTVLRRWREVSRRYSGPAWGRSRLRPA